MSSIYKVAQKFERKLTGIDEMAYKKIQELYLNVYKIPIKIVSGYLTYLSKPSLHILDNTFVNLLISDMEEFKRNINDYFQNIRSRKITNKQDHLRKLSGFQSTIMKINKDLRGMRDDIRREEELRKDISTSTKKIYAPIFAKIEECSKLLDKAFENCSGIRDWVEISGDVMPVIPGKVELGAPQIGSDVIPLPYSEPDLEPLVSSYENSSIGTGVPSAGRTK
jgi:predicted RNase H-like nuclease (RuvC/YqgF family)